MELNFAALTAAVDNVTSEITTVVGILTNPVVNNADQAVIDDITSRLSSAAAGLQAALPAPAAPAAADPAPADAPLDPSA